MIDISEKEFIEYLERYANNEISMTELVKILETEYRTLNKKIIEMSINNPNLYYKIIINHPYKQKSRSDIDFEGLVIYILKQGITIGQAADIFNISRRTIQRRVNELEDTNPVLYDLFKKTVGREATKKISPDLQEKINELEYKNVVIGEINDEREKFLLELEERFNNLLMTGLTKEQASKQMGYRFPYIYKALNELYRLKIEKNVKKDKDNKQKEFRENLSDMTKYTNQSVEGRNASNLEQVQNNEAR